MFRPVALRERRNNKMSASILGCGSDACSGCDVAVVGRWVCSLG